MLTHEQLIKLFLAEWLEWVKADAEEPHFIFCRSQGLCALLNRWMLRQEHSNTTCTEVAHHFWGMLGKKHLPFNRYYCERPDMPLYSQEASNGTMHENHLRLKWAQENCK